MLARTAEPGWIKPSERPEAIAAKWFDVEAAAAPRSFIETPMPADRSQKPAFKTATEFCSEYVPLSYAIDPLVRSGSLYTLTAKTGSGKTAWLLLVLLAVATGRRDILGIEVERGRVALLTFENPDDVRMRLMIAASVFGVDVAELGDWLVVLDQRERPEWIVPQLASLSRGGSFKLILIDTLAAFFDGDDVNSATQGGEFMRRIRPMTRLQSLPSVVVAAHPVKNASEDQLVPYGSGAILNEVDGNLTLWRRPDTGVISLHWQGKLRGIEFQPVSYEIRTATCSHVKDAKGRLVELPYMVAATQDDEEARQAAEIDIDAMILLAVQVDGRITQRALAARVGRTVSVVNAKLKRFKRDGWITEALGAFTLTKKGAAALEKRP